MLKFFRIPFANAGDRTAVPDAVDPSGNVSYTQGYGFDYERQKTDPAHKNIERDKANSIYFDLSNALGEIQSQGVPDFITTALNGGTAYSYSVNAVVRYANDLYVSLANANTTLPTDTSKWALLPTAGRIQSGAYVNAATVVGTVDAIAATFLPALTALTSQRLRVRATGANTTATPTFAPDGLTAKTVVKGSNQALVPGDIAGAGAWLDLQYDVTLDKWILLNPAFGVAATGKPKFLANRGVSSVTLPNATATKVVFNSETVDIGGGFDTTTGRFTVPAGGEGDYEFDSTVLLVLDQLGAAYITLFKNGAQSRYGGSAPFARTTDQVYVHGSWLEPDCIAGDYFEIFVSQNTTVNASIIASTVGTTFAGKWAGK